MAKRKTKEVYLGTIRGKDYYAIKEDSEEWHIYAVTNDEQWRRVTSQPLSSSEVRKIFAKIKRSFK
jgi:hypothetical protein